ncbi:MAG: hypothetical protein AB199_00765 [Parcubacteria bacterium C7867-004]|nr:MAG: hypothetical protein AB199_00765 [Parcubacteria bacterium C7867-004]
MRTIRFIPLLACVLGFALDKAAIWCVYSITGCPLRGVFNYLFEIFVTPYYLFSAAFVIPSVILLVVSDSAFKAWFKFARWWLPLSLLLILLTPDYNSNAFFVIFDYSKLATAQFMAICFTAISLIIIAYRSFTEKKKRAP